MATFTFGYATLIYPNGLGDGTDTSWTVGGSTYTGTYSFTESDGVLTVGSGGLQNYHNENDAVDSYTPADLPPSGNSFGLHIYDGYYDDGAGTTGIIILDDAYGVHYLYTNQDPGFTGGESITSSLVNYCFLEGTMIAAPAGEIAVEELNIGDLVLTADGSVVAVKWIGRQHRYNIGSISAKYAPVRISAGALGNGLPKSDLCVTADHGLIVDGLLINASALVNGTSIRYVPMSEMPESYTYYHIETHSHDVVLANGAPAETFIDYESRRDFSNYAEYVALYGDEPVIAELPMPRISSRRQLPADLRARFGIGGFGEDVTAQALAFLAEKRVA